MAGEHYRDILTYREFHKLREEKDLIHTCACVQLVNVWLGRLNDAERNKADIVLCEFASEKEVYQSLQGGMDPLLKFGKLSEVPRGKFWLTIEVGKKKWVYRSTDGVLPERHLRLAEASIGITGRDTSAIPGTDAQNLAVASAKCANCDKRLEGDHSRVCGGCRVVCYCDTNCQKSHWKNGHKKVCRTPLDRSPRTMPAELASELDEMMRRRCRISG